MADRGHFLVMALLMKRMSELMNKDREDTVACVASGRLQVQVKGGITRVAIRLCGFQAHGESRFSTRFQVAIVTMAGSSHAAL